MRMRRILLNVLFSGLLCGLFSGLFFGCVSSNDLVNIIPNNSFDTFEYHRAASGWTKDIIAEGAKVTDDELSVDSISIKSTYPFVSFDIRMKGYTREIDKSTEITNDATEYDID